MKRIKITTGRERQIEILNQAKKLEETTKLNRNEIAERLGVNKSNLYSWNAKHQILPFKRSSAGRPRGSKNKPKTTQSVVNFSNIEPITEPPVTVVLFQGSSRTVASTLNRFLTSQQ